MFFIVKLLDAAVEEGLVIVETVNCISPLVTYEVEAINHFCQTSTTFVAEHIISHNQLI